MKYIHRWKIKAGFLLTSLFFAGFMVAPNALAAATWNDVTPSGATHNLAWQTVASSADGTHLVAAVNGGDIYTSVDSGATWNDVTPSGATHNLAWQTVASSGTGQYLVAATSTGPIYLSSDYGSTWTAFNDSEHWTSVAITSDGSKLFGVANNSAYIMSAPKRRLWFPLGSTVPSGGGLTWNAIAISSGRQQSGYRVHPHRRRRQ